MEKSNDLCSHCGNAGYLQYYYLGLKTKIKNWLCYEFWRKILSHWKERDHWLGREKRYPLKKEVWDGRDGGNFSGSGTQTFCNSCRKPLSADHLRNSPDCHDGSKSVTCPKCLETLNHTIQLAHGCPLNLALIGHWYGWQPFGTSHKACGSIEVSIANMTKNDQAMKKKFLLLGLYLATKFLTCLKQWSPYWMMFAMAVFMDLVCWIIPKV